MSLKLLERFFCFLLEPICPTCEKAVTSFQLCSACSHFPLNSTKNKSTWVASSFLLNETARLLLHSIKYHHKTERLRLLREILPEDFSLELEPGTILIPVPLSKARFYERGFNQAEWLAHKMSRKLEFRVENNGLLKTRDTLPQSTLAKSQRRTNLSGAFLWNKETPVPAKACIIDDIFTTGSTLEACKATLMQAGVQQIFGWTLFKTVPSIFQSRLNIYATRTTSIGKLPINTNC